MRLIVDEGEHLPAVPEMISRCDYLDAALAQISKHRLGQPKASGGVLAVGDAHLDVMLSDDVGEQIGHGLPARLADDIGDEQDVHRTALCGCSVAVIYFA
jgi:hypothetical protein